MELPYEIVVVLVVAVVLVPKVVVETILPSLPFVVQEVAGFLR